MKSRTFVGGTLCSCEGSRVQPLYPMMKETSGVAKFAYDT